jgi:ribosomal protein S18 acetylase RimI-like enzyme
MELIEFLPLSREEFNCFYQDFIIEYANIMVKAKMFQDRQEAINTAKTQLLAFFPEGLATKGQHLFKLKQSAQHVGILWYSETEATNKHGMTAWLCYISIEPAFRRRGYAKAAIKKMEAHLKSLGIEWVGLNIFSYNSSAKQLYESLGYTVVKTILTVGSNEISRYELSKNLSH